MKEIGENKIYIIQNIVVESIISIIMDLIIMKTINLWNQNLLFFRWISKKNII